MLDKLNLLLDKHNYKEIKELLKEENEYDIADVLNDLQFKDLIKVFRLLSKDKEADVFAYLDSDMQVNLISSLTDNEAVDIINELDSDDATDLVEEMPAIIVSKILSKVDKETRRNINLLLKYPENSAGSIMGIEYIDIKENNTIKQAIIKIRKEAKETDVLHDYFILDSKRKLIGTINVKDLLINSEDKIVQDVMDTNFQYVNTQTDQEEVAEIFTKYDLTTLAVVDNENRLVGVITFDDIMDIIEDETTEDIEKMAAIVPTEKPYLKLSTWEIWKSRIPWLLILMISATFTSKIIQHYELSLSKYVILTSFIPMLMDTGGNAGSQSSITIIRGLSLNDIEFKDIFKVIFKEIRVSILIGIVLGIANFIKLLLIDQVSVIIALVVCLTLMITILVAKIVGCSLPLIAEKLGFDPAVMASPFITTIIDAVSLIIYFSIAASILNI